MQGIEAVPGGRGSGTEGTGVPAESVAAVQALYDRGLYLEAHRRAEAAAPLARWSGTRARLLAGRLAGNLGAPRLACRHWLGAWRGDRRDPEASCYYAMALAQSRGALPAWEFMCRSGALDGAPASQRAVWLGMRATLLGRFRDFERADAAMAEALRLSPDDPWLEVDRADLLEIEDRIDAALDAAQHALALRPWYRPAVNRAAHLLAHLGRDDEAIALLEGAMARLESYSIALQLAELHVERAEYQAARAVLDRAAELAPLADRTLAPVLAGLRSDVAYSCGDLARSAALAEEARSHPYYERLARNLAAATPPLQRTVLPVGFVRQHHMTCAPATLAAIGRYWSMPVDHLEIAEQICYDGTSNESERRWAAANGWVTREFTVTLDAARQLIDRGFPFTLSTVEPASAHLQAVIGYDLARGTLVARDPSHRRSVELLAEELARDQRAVGPRGHVFAPPARAGDLFGLDLPDADAYDHYHGVQQALADHRRDDAGAAQRRMAEAFPAHRLTHGAALSLACYDADPRRAIEACDRLLELFPGDPRILLSKLVHQRELGRSVERLAIYESICARRDCPPVFWQQFAQALAEDAAQVRRAERLVRRAIRAWTDIGGSLFILANMRWGQRDFEAATELYRLAACADDRKEQLARAYFAACRHLGREDEAIALLEARFRRLGDRSGQPARSLHEALEELDRAGRAADVLEEALRRRPDDGDLLLFAADAASRVGDLDLAARHLGEARGKAQQTAWLRCAARLARNQGRRDDARSAWQQVVEAEPLAADAHRELSLILAETSGRQAALEHLRQAVRTCPHWRPAHTLLAEWLRDDDSEAATEAVDAVIALNPADAWAHRERAVHLVRLRRDAEAMASAQEALRLEPNNPTGWTVLGDVHEHAGRVEEARQAFRRAIDLSADAEYAIARLARSCDSRAERALALEFVRGRLRAQLTDGDGLLAWVSAARDTLGAETILAQLREAWTSRPDQWVTWSLLINQLVATDALDEALRIAMDAAARFPLVPRIHFDLAHVHGARNETEGRIAALQQSLRINADLAPSILELASTYDRLGRIGESRALLERAARRTPLDASLRAALALAHWKSGDRDRAFAEVEQAIDLDPVHEAAWDRLSTWAAQTGEDGRAAALARRLSARRGGDVQSWLTLARVLNGPADVDERVAAAARAVELEPRNVDAHVLRAQILAASGRYEEARAACRPPAWPGVVPHLLRAEAARIEAARGDLSAAIAQMTAVLQDEPDYFAGWAHLADWQAEAADHGLAAAEQLLRLAPRHPMGMVYVADARRHAGDAAGALEMFRAAFSLAPDYVYAGTALVALLIDARSLDEAQRVIDTMELHVRDWPVSVCRVRLAAARGDAAAALAPIADLCRRRSAGIENALRMAMDIMVAAGWRRAAEDAIDAALREGGAHPDAGYWWVRLGAARSLRCVRNRVKALASRGAPDRRALLAAVEAYDDNPAGRGGSRFVRRWSARIEADGAAWAAAIRVLNVHRRRLAVRWASRWRERGDLEPWMLLSVVYVLYGGGRYDDAAAAATSCAGAPRDHATDRLALWAAAEDAIRGNPDSARDRLRIAASAELEPYWCFIRDCARALVEAADERGAGRRDWFRAGRARLAQAARAFPTYRSNIDVARLRWRAARALARERGGAAAHLWSLGKAGWVWSTRPMQYALIAAGALIGLTLAVLRP